jgi:hypothetical protein
MPKAIKGNASRKPPEPTDHSDVDDWFQRQMPHLQPIVKRLDETERFRTTRVIAVTLSG